jgi:hypothetical protein
MNRELIEALVTPGHQEQYRNSAAFYNAVNTLAAMLPAMVAGLAAEAEEQDRKAVQAVMLARSEPARFSPPLM